MRAVEVQINGVLGATGPFSPQPIAEAITRPEQDWTPHVSHDG
ncbi:hypothetical protein [Nocardia sp. NPDC005825]